MACAPTAVITFSRERCTQHISSEGEEEVRTHPSPSTLTTTDYYDPNRLPSQPWYIRNSYNLLEIADIGGFPAWRTTCLRATPTGSLTYPFHQECPIRLGNHQASRAGRPANDIPSAIMESRRSNTVRTCQGDFFITGVAGPSTCMGVFAVLTFCQTAPISLFDPVRAAGV